MPNEDKSEVQERQRIEVPDDYKILDKAPELAFDRLTRLAADIFNVPMAAIILMDDETQWFKSSVGLNLDEVPKDLDFFNLTPDNEEILMVADAAQDNRFKDNPLVNGPPNLRFYAGCLLMNPQKTPLGILWIGDIKSRSLLTHEELNRLQSIADIAMSEMAMRREVEKKRIAQQEAAQARTDLELALALSSTASWSLNTTTDRISWGGAYFKVWGDDTDEVLLTSADAFERIHPDDRARVMQAVEDALDLESEGYQETFRIILPDGEVRWLIGRGNYVRNFDHDAITGVNYDITESIRQEEAQKLHTRELHHRLRNLFATLQSIMTLTKSSATSIDDYIERIDGRLRALNRAQQILLDTNFVTGSFRSLVNDLCQSYPKIKWSGPDVTLAENSMVAISLVLNEMATNAAKYGALSNGQGRVDIDWQLQEQDDGPSLVVLNWSETGGPKVDAEPERKGFGSSLIDMSIKNNLKGALERQWREDGLKCTLTFPISAAKA